MTSVIVWDRPSTARQICVDSRGRDSDSKACRRARRWPFASICAVFRRVACRRSSRDSQRRILWMTWVIAHHLVVRRHCTGCPAGRPGLCIQCSRIVLLHHGRQDTSLRRRSDRTAFRPLRPSQRILCTRRDGRRRNRLHIRISWGSWPWISGVIVVSWFSLVFLSGRNSRLVRCIDQSFPDPDAIWAGPATATPHPTVTQIACDVATQS